jgi:hypothetical protein
MMMDTFANRRDRPDDERIETVAVATTGHD